jgi:hypothetical protein
VSAAEGKLGYRYGPVPVWVFEAYGRGELNLGRFVVLAYLFHFARSEPLSKRRPTPTLTLKELADAIRWGKELSPGSARSSLSHFLNRMKAAGLLAYRVTGDPKRAGYSYTFSLFPDGPRPPTPRPTRRAAARPSLNGARSQSQSGIEAEAASEASELEDGAASDPPSDLAASASDLREPGNVGAERDRADAPEGARPTSLDVLDEGLNPHRRSEAAEGKTTRAVGAGDEEPSRLFEVERRRRPWE